MSTKYKYPKDVPIEILISRLNELSDIITGENPKQNMEREFNMRIPAEYDRDPDLVMAISATRMKDITKENEHLAEVINKRDVTIKYLVDWINEDLNALLDIKDFI